MRNRMIAAIACVSLCLALAPLARAQQPQDLLSERALPATTVAAVILPDVTGAGDAFKQTALYELFQDPEVQAMFAPIVREWLANWNMLSPLSPIKPEDLAQLLSGEAAIALAMDGQPAQPRPAIHIVLKPRAFQAAQDSWQKILAFLTATEAIRGQTAANGGTLCQMKNGVLAVTPRDNAILFTFGPPHCAPDCHNELVARLAGPADSLGRVPAYSAVINKVGRHNVLRVYFDPAPIYTLGLVPPGVQSVIGVLGLRQAGPLFLGASFQDRGLRLSAYLAAPAPRAGLLTLFNGAPLTANDYALIPASAAAFKTGRMNLVSLFDTVVTLIKSLGNEEPQDVDAAIATADKELGLSIRNDILGQFTDQYAFYRLGGETPGSSNILLKVKDERAAATNMRKLMDAIAALIGRNAKVDPVQWVRSAEIQRQGFFQVYPNSILPAAVTPNLIFAKGWMLAAFSARDALAAAPQLLNPGPSVLTRKDFADLIKRMPPNPIVTAYSDSAAYAGNALEWVQFLGDLGHMFAKIGIQNEKKPIPFRLTEPQWLDPGRFPSEDILRSKLFGAVSVVSVDAQGIWFESFSAAGPIPPLMRPSAMGGTTYQVPVLAGILLPALARARGEARNTNEKHSLHQIGKAMVAYAGDHRDMNPPSLADLQPDYVADARLFLSPHDDAGEAPKLKNGAPCSFCYVGSLPSRDVTPETWVAYTRKGINERGRNVLYFDCHAQFLPESVFQQELSRQAREIFTPLLQKKAPGLDPARVQAFLNDEFYDK